MAAQALTESKKATYWQRVAFFLGVIVAVETAIGLYYTFQATSSSHPNVTAEVSLGWVETANGITIAQHTSQVPRPVGASDAVIFDVTDKGGTGIRIESLTIKYKCRPDGRCDQDTFFQTSNVGQLSGLTLPLYLQPDDSVSLPVPLACDHDVLKPALPTETIHVQGIVTLTGGQAISAGSLTIPPISTKAVQSCIRHHRSAG